MKTKQLVISLRAVALAVAATFAATLGAADFTPASQATSAVVTVRPAVRHSLASQEITVSTALRAFFIIVR